MFMGNNYFGENVQPASYITCNTVTSQQDETRQCVFMGAAATVGLAYGAC